MSALQNIPHVYPLPHRLILEWAARPKGVSNSQVHGYLTKYHGADIEDALRELRAWGLIAIANGIWYRRHAQV